MKINQINVSRLISNVGIEELSDMQKESLEAFPDHPEIIISAPTGSGKTLAYLLMILKIIPAGKNKTYAIIITPTRELALQVTSVFQSLKTGHKITTCYGGHKREIEENNLAEPPSLIVGTPGRLGDHLRRGNISTENIQTIVLDEFDKSIELGFLDEMKFLFDSLKDLKYKILISATPAKEFPPFLEINNPLILDFSNVKNEGLRIHKLSVGDKEKDQLLFELLCSIGNRRTIIFVTRKETVMQLEKYLSGQGISTAAYHGSMEQQERETSITKFRNGSVSFLVTTDLASRGLDITNVRFIIHYDRPESEQVFTHRNGRTARMDASGEVILMSDQNKQLPGYVDPDIPEFEIKKNAEPPMKSEWGTLFISGGKKDKINKIDIAGFLMQKGGLKREDTGLIEVKDFYSFAAVRRSRMNALIGMGQEQKIKNKKVKIAAAK